jgi:DeoR family fructose operon transcriptional repressor
MLAEERQNRILETLNERENGAVSVKELSAIFDTSEMTIRRDLDTLYKRGLLKRVHGGAISQGAVLEKPFDERYDDYNLQKETIGKLASKMIADGDTIILDAGTTSQQIARNLNETIGITVITNALPVAAELSHYANVSTILLGGMLKHKESCTVGPTVIQELSRFSVDKLFLTASGFSLEKGVTDPDLREVEVKQAMIRSASEIILVADSSKWDVITLVKITSIGSIDKLISDECLPAEAIAALKANGVEVIIADTTLKPAE